MQLCQEQNVTSPLPRLILHHDKLAVFCSDLASGPETIPTILNMDCPTSAPKFAMIARRGN